MPCKRRTADLEISFDGLTDSVTNLVGTLILLIVLLLAITTSRTNLPDGERSAGVEPKRLTDVWQLQIKAEAMTLAIDETNRQIAEIRAELPELEQKVDALVSQALSTGNQ